MPKYTHPTFLAGIILSVATSCARQPTPVDLPTIHTGTLDVPLGLPQPPATIANLSCDASQCTISEAQRDDLVAYFATLATWMGKMSTTYTTPPICPDAQFCGSDIPTADANTPPQGSIGATPNMPIGVQSDAQR